MSERYVFLVTLTTDNDPNDVLDDLFDLVTDAAGGFVGDPDRALGGAQTIIVAHA